MGKRGGRSPEASAEDLELFAAFVRGEERAEREAKAAQKAARREVAEQERLQRAKEEAAAEVKRLRGSTRATADEKAAADEAYKAALAAVVAAETGTTPAWAPPETAVDAGADDEPTGTEVPESASPADDHPTAEPSTGDETTDGDDTTDGDETEPAPSTGDDGQ